MTFGPANELAILSPCERYRYWLRRPLNTGTVSVGFIMLNPSTADAEQDDPTIRRCKAFAQALDARELIVVNLFAFRATDPKDLKRAKSPIGPDNDAAIDAAMNRCHVLIAAWGAHGKFKSRGDRVRSRIRHAGGQLHYLKMTASGQPSHPLYLKSDQPLTEWA